MISQCETLCETYEATFTRGRRHRAIENGVTQEELVELITHLAFYAGWPNAMSAATRAKELLAKK